MNHMIDERLPRPPDIVEITVSLLIFWLRPRLNPAAAERFFFRLSTLAGACEPVMQRRPQTELA